MNKNVFINNRKNMLNLMCNNSILVTFSNRPYEDASKFQVNRNYYYLCGLFEYENIVLLVKNDHMNDSMIYINPYDEFKAKWVGAPISKDEVTSISGIDSIKYLDSFKTNLYSLLATHPNIYLDLPQNSLDSALTYEEKLASDIKAKCPYANVLNSSPLFTKLRTIKSEAEIEEYKKAVEITKHGVEALMTNIGPMKEYQLESYFDQAIKYYGATGHSFPTIAASGKNATCLHYSTNDGDLKDGDLILFDLGASYNMYCADISRTFPVSGKFTQRQKLLYNIVLGGQSLVFNNIKPGITTRELNQILVKYYAVELKKIGLISDDSEVSKYYYHGVSHHIGLDTHDLCEYGPLKPGCIISNEPGLYIPEEGIGIRIEDDVLVTENGAINLSAGIIKTVDEIEYFIAKARGQL